jgi:hypothetical protein
MEAMHRRFRRLSDTASARFRALDRRLGIDHRGRSEWIWAAPVFTFVGTCVLVTIAGAITTGTTPLLYAPIAVLLGLIMAGMSIAYMTPEDGAGGDDGGDGGSRPVPTQPPAPLRDWSHWLDGPQAPQLPEEPATPRPRTAPVDRRDRDEELVGR